MSRAFGADGTSDLETTRILAFVAVAFGVAWLVGLYVYLTGGLGGRVRSLAGMPVSETLVLLAVGYMGAPAVANVAARVATGEGWRNLRLRPRFRRGWPYWLAGLLMPPALALFGVTTYFLLFVGQYDRRLSTLRNAPGVAAAAETLPGGLWALLALYLLQALLVSALVNSIVTFGEEFGWRGYLLYKLLPLGGRRAALLTGVVWGVWHWPVVAMGYNYGLDYPGAPWLGLLAMVWFTVVAGVVLAWMTIRGRSVWPAVLGHATINGFAGIGVLFLRDGATTNPILGPLGPGLLVTVPWAVVAGYLLVTPGSFDPVGSETAGPSGDEEREG